MKRRTLKKAYFVTIAVTFLIGLILGTFIEKEYGVEALLTAVRTNDWTILQPQTTGISDGNIPDDYQGKLQLFILAGQSNMSGLGELPPSEMETHPQIYVFGNDYLWKRAKEPVDDPKNQVDNVSLDTDAAFGPSVSFATTVIKQRPDMVLGLIPCAKGGASIQDWQKKLSDNTLYGSCLKRVRAASVMGTVAGFLFLQGEIDTLDPKEAPERTFLPNRWADEFAALVRDWRSDLNLPDLPVVFAQIGTNADPDRFKNWAIVKEQQRQVRLPSTSMITTDDLALKDYVHFTTESYQTIGQRFAKAYLDLL